MRINSVFYLIVGLLVMSCNQEQRHIKTGDVLPETKVDSLVLLAAQENDSLNRRALFRLAVSVYGNGDDQKFKQICDFALQRSILAGDTIAMIKARSYIGKYFGNRNITDSAYVNYSKAEKLALAVKDNKSLGNIYVSEAFIYLYVNDYSSCEIAASKALYYIDADDKKRMYDAYNLIGICSNEMQRYSQAINYHNKALELINNNPINDPYHLGANSLNNIGVVFQNMDNHGKAIKYFQRALTDRKLHKEAPSLYAILLDNLAYSRFKTKNEKDVPNLFFTALKIRDSLNLTSGIVVNKIHLSEYFAFHKDSTQARRWAHEALDLSKKTGISGDILLALNQISSIESKDAIAYSREYIEISDSIQKVERSVRDKFARIQMETREISQERNKLEVQNRNLVYVTIGLLLIGALLFIIRTQRAKNRELLLMQAQQKANEEIYNLIINQQEIIEESRVKEKKRIAQELHDGILGRLFGTRLNLDSLNKSNGFEAEVKRTEYLIELKNIEQDIREISHDLNREKFALINNFITILNNFFDNQNESFPAIVKFQVDNDILWDKIPNNTKINIYRVVQESIQNINKYAQAKNIFLRITRKLNFITLSIIDDGIGFDIHSKKKGIGLQNIMSRANEINGELKLESSIGKGTKILLKLPYEV